MGDVQQMIVRVPEGKRLPKGWIFARLLGETMEPVGIGTNMRRVFTVQVNSYGDPGPEGGRDVQC